MDDGGWYEDGCRLEGEGMGAWMCEGDGARESGVDLVMLRKLDAYGGIR